jgi:hypothetical protein
LPAAAAVLARAVDAFTAATRLAGGFGSYDGLIPTGTGKSHTKWWNLERDIGHRNSKSRERYMWYVSWAE